VKIPVTDIDETEWQHMPGDAVTVAVVTSEGKAGKQVAIMMGGRVFVMETAAEVEIAIEELRRSAALAWPKEQGA
jgi:hypothetical protein